MGLRNRNLSNNDGDDDREIFDEFDDFTEAGIRFEDYSDLGNDFEFSVAERNGSGRVRKAQSVKKQPKTAKSSSSSSSVVKWVVQGRQLQVGSQVYNLRQTYTYGYEPARLSSDSQQDSTPMAYLAYQFPVPGAQRYVVYPDAVEGQLRPVERLEQLQQVPAQQVVWMVVFTGETGKGVRRLLREFLRSL
ncbi:hypothetical protein H6G20_05410 [Desertifilum sp. FACHB-1129]|uniref:hypothetical protein n=1 Tax=unclassified Desertifilum TaxID=2621682 RepID=UPI00168801B9|nr:MULTISPECIES: hypothetical protein [unclassified Desertifilum]MBD2311121.1 hypothetical protein [Desertifilum sp. FACHB-1129]MBD2323988.1 hypothetical protein [Desertifilum sp. FACHB-866]MBD2333923.1 hypothetical protein [Desertifilum sp. FACHB-868]MDA0211234.1 hypothetical protein [Cyanobacteria bacterium FC1]